MSFFVIGPPQTGCFKVVGGLRVNKPVKELIWSVLTAASGYDEAKEPFFSEVITRGDEDGVDRLASAWADKHMLPHIGIPARVSSFGPKKAEEVQIKEILDRKPSYAISFKSKETRKFTDKLNELGLTIFEIDLEKALDEQRASKT